MPIRIDIGSVVTNSGVDGHGSTVRVHQVQGWEAGRVEQSWVSRLTTSGAVVGLSRVDAQVVVFTGTVTGTSPTGAWNSHETLRSAAMTAVSTAVTITLYAPSGNQTLSGCLTTDYRTEWLTDRTWRWQWTLTSGSPR